MTPIGLESVKHHFDGRAQSSSRLKLKRFIIPHDIRDEVKKDSVVWKNFRRFPESYKRIRIGWIDGSRRRPEFFKKRLQYFLKMTAQNKKFGMVQ
jgi:hypothetical protein